MDLLIQMVMYGGTWYHHTMKTVPGGQLQLISAWLPANKIRYKSK